MAGAPGSNTKLPPAPLRHRKAIQVDLQRQFMRALNKRNLTMVDVADHVGVSRQRVHQIITGHTNVATAIGRGGFLLPSMEMLMSVLAAMDITLEVKFVDVKKELDDAA